jgi:hypothetical protein
VDAGRDSGGPGGGPPAGYPECTTAADCELFTDCCSCLAVRKGTSMASCKMMCLQSDCAAHRITVADVTCRAGRCVLNRSCNDKAVICNGPTPACATDTGQAAVVVNGCYDGSCLPVSECSDVASCDVCTKAGLLCASFAERSGPTFQCVTTPEKCVTAPTCACMGVCSGWFQCTEPLGRSLACQCPTC